MPLKIRVASQLISDDAKQAFVSYTRFVFSLYSSLRRQRGIPSCRLEALLTDDFVPEVRRLCLEQGSDTAEPDFTQERVGGLVAAKTLSMDRDHSRVVAVFDSNFWRNHDDPTGTATAEELFTVAHELAHVLFQRASYASGALEGVPFPSVTGREQARSLSRILGEEYRADRLADFVVRHASTSTVDGQPARIGLWEVWSERYLPYLLTALEAAYPAWPDIVQAYREWRSDLQTMWLTVGQSVSQTLTLLLHLQALADNAGGPNLLEAEPFVSLQAVRLYLAESWPSLLGTIRATPILPAIVKYKQCEDEIVRVGETVILDIFKCLGLDIEDRANRRWSLWVREPKR